MQPSLSKLRHETGEDSRNSYQLEVSTDEQDLGEASPGCDEPEVIGPITGGPGWRQLRDGGDAADNFSLSLGKGGLLRGLEIIKV